MKKKKNWGGFSKEQIAAQLKEEILEHVRLLASGRVQTVYPIVERGKELLEIEKETKRLPESISPTDF